MGRGNITRRGKRSWRIKFDVDVGADGKRETRYVTIKGTKKDAARELTKLLGAADQRTLVEPSKTTVAEMVRGWIAAQQGSLKTLERYRELTEGQIVPHLGAIIVQKLRPDDIAKWHVALLAGGARNGGPLSARTVTHAHKILRRALKEAVRRETLARNVADAIKPPKIEAEEVVILRADQIEEVLTKLKSDRLYTISALALATGMRRGELLGLQIGDVNFDGATIRVERSLQETATGLRFKGPKSKHGRRVISLPPSALAFLRGHWTRQLELRMALGLGKPGPDALIFSTPEGKPLSPDNLSRDWKRACDALGLPRVMFHSLRHTHASALIAAGIDVVQISKRLGHGSPVITLGVYAHLFKTDDGAAAAAAESLFRKPAGS